MTNQELNTALYERMFAEQEQYRAWLLQAPEEILNHTYEYTVREDILMALEYHDLPDAQARALLASPSPLADVFADWENKETGYMEGIRRRILAQQRAERPLPKPKPKAHRAVLRGNLKSARKITGFRALYFHYCYLLGIFPRNRPASNKRLHFLLQEDLAKLDAIIEETKLLVGHRIDTDEQLFRIRKVWSRKSRC